MYKLTWPRMLYYNCIWPGTYKTWCICYNLSPFLPYLLYCLHTDWFPLLYTKCSFQHIWRLNEHSRILFIGKYWNKKNRVKIHMLILCMRKQNGRYAPFKYGLTNRIWPSDDDMIVCVSVWKYVSKIKRGGASIVFFCCIYSC